MEAIRNLLGIEKEVNPKMRELANSLSQGYGGEVQVGKSRTIMHPSEMIDIDEEELKGGILEI